MLSCKLPDLYSKHLFREVLNPFADVKLPKDSMSLREKANKAVKQVKRIQDKIDRLFYGKDIDLEEEDKLKRVVKRKKTKVRTLLLKNKSTRRPVKCNKEVLENSERLAKKRRTKKKEDNSIKVKKLFSATSVNYHRRSISYDPNLIHKNDSESVKRAISTINAESRRADRLRISFQTDLQPVEQAAHKNKKRFLNLMMTADEKKYREEPRRAFLYSSGGGYSPAEDLLDVWEFDKIVGCNDEVTFKHRNQLAQKYDPDLQHIKELQINIPQERKKTTSFDRIVNNNGKIGLLKAISSQEEQKLLVHLDRIEEKEQKYQNILARRKRMLEYKLANRKQVNTAQSASLSYTEE